MNSFKKDTKPKATFLICKDYSINADNLQENIKNKFQNKSNLNDSFSLVYIYYLVDKKYTYPKKESDVLYIGSTIGQIINGEKSAAFRFAHLKSGKDNKQNITLQYFYNVGNVIGLDIFEVDNCRCVEKQWRYEFLDQYGALPIADGAAYSNGKCILPADNEET